MCVFAPVHGLFAYSEYLNSNLFWAGDSRFCGVFRHFTFLQHRSKGAILIIASMNYCFWDPSFELVKNLATLDSGKFQYFYGVLLYHGYTPRHLTWEKKNEGGILDSSSFEINHVSTIESYIRNTYGVSSYVWCISSETCWQTLSYNCL